MGDSLLSRRDACREPLSRAAVTGRAGRLYNTAPLNSSIAQKEAFVMLIRLLGIVLNPLLKRQGKTLVIVRRRR